jgi:hypothetical protein
MQVVRLKLVVCLTAHGQQSDLIPLCLTNIARPLDIMNSSEVKILLVFLFIPTIHKITYFIHIRFILHIDTYTHIHTYINLTERKASC